MKIILSAFNKMWSHPMDVPEETGRIFKLVLTQPIQAISNFDGDTIYTNPPFNTICEFEYTGKLIEDARIYVLRDISKY